MEWAEFEQEHRDRPDRVLLAATTLASVSRVQNDDIVVAVLVVLDAATDRARRTG
jgi:hypothetical protein